MVKRKSIINKLMVLGLCSALVTTSIPDMTAFAMESSVRTLSLSKLESTSELQALKNKMSVNSKAVTKSYDPKKEVTVIVKLKDDSLLNQFTDKVSASKTNTQTFSEYVTSKTGKSLQAKLEKKQNQVLSTIKNGKDVKSDVKVLYHYTSVMNGFAIKVQY